MMLLKDTQVAEILSVSRPTVWRWVHSDALPKPIKIAGSTRWKLEEIEAWVNNQEVRSDA